MNLTTVIFSAGLSLSNTQPAQLATHATYFEKKEKPEWHFETMHDQENIKEIAKSQYNISGSSNSMESQFNGYYHNIKEANTGQTIYGGWEPR